MFCLHVPFPVVFSREGPGALPGKFAPGMLAIESDSFVVLVIFVPLQVGDSSEPHLTAWEFAFEFRVVVSSVVLKLMLCGEFSVLEVFVFWALFVVFCYAPFILAIKEAVGARANLGAICGRWGWRWR